MVKLEIEFDGERRETLASLRQRVQSSGEEALLLLRNGKLSVERPPEPEVDPERELERQRLRRRVEEMDYQKLVKNVAHGGGQPVEERAGALSTHASIGVNMIVGMATMFFVGYTVCRTLGTDTKWHLVGGLAGCISMMLIEMILYISRLYGVENAPSVQSVQSVPVSDPKKSVPKKEEEAKTTTTTKKKKQ